ncbi:MAG TPA: CHAT domain-containing protein [Pyrinomonadaceae bacterium]|nr:CHAT domain-containing protein [Pyrinomonadaceae bacterium]
MEPPTTPTEIKQTIDWLNKLVAMAQWDAKLPFYTATLFSKPKPYQQFLREAKAEKIGVPDAPSPAEVETPFALAHRKLLERIAVTQQLHEMFGADQDPFYGASHEYLQLLAEVSDMSIDPSSEVSSRNGTFLAVCDELRRSKEWQTQQIDTFLIDCLKKFLSLVETDEPIAKMLHELSLTPYWYVVLASLRDKLEYALEEGPAAAETVNQWRAKLTTDLRKLLFKPGHLSRAPIMLIRIAWTELETIKNVGRSLPPPAPDEDPDELRKQVATEALPLLKKKWATVFLGIESDLKVLAIVARHFINVRKFAKLDGFVYTWPEIARLGMANYVALEYVEEVLVGKRKATETELEAKEATDLYNKCQNNHALIRFLRLKPYFSEIDENELRRYRPLAPIVITDTPPKSPVEQARSGDFAPQQQPASPSTPKRFDVSVLHIKRMTEVLSESETAYEVALSGRDPRQTSGPLFAVRKLLENIRSSMGASSDVNLQEVLKELFSSSPTLAEERMARGGLTLENQIFLPELSDEIRILPLGKGRRLIINSPDGEIHFLPWEWLPAKVTPGVLLASPDYSIVRGALEKPTDPPYLATPPPISPAPLIPPPLIPPLRVLGIFPTAPRGRRFTSEETLKTLGPLLTTAGGDFKFLVESDATLKNVEFYLDDLKPQVVHFEGYMGTASTTGFETDELRILLSKPDNEGIPVEWFGGLLKGKGVQLLVTGRNSTTRLYDNRIAIAALRMLKAGVPAIITPIRAIADASATTFTAEFYSAFLQENTLEAALHIARRKLASKGGDWSVFALFADPARLDSFQLLLEIA